MEANNINIEEIMADIKREIKEKGLTNDMLSFEEVPYRKSQAGGSPEEALEYVTSNYYIQPYKELNGNPLKVLFKKIVRKVAKFYVEPVVMEQNDFNTNVAVVLKDLSERDEAKMLSRMEAIELENKELMLRLDKLEHENNELREQLGKQGRE